MKIRLMNIEDYDQVYKLWINTSGMGLNNLDDSRESIERYLRRNPNTCFVAEEKGRIAGVIISGHDGRRGFIYHTAVAMDCRRKGIGKMLTDYALKALEKEGIHKVALVAFSHNEQGNAFWESVGFSRRDDLTYRNKTIHESERIDT